MQEVILPPFIIPKVLPKADPAREIRDDRPVSFIFASGLHWILKERGMKQKELATLTGIPYRKISEVIDGRRNIGTNLMGKIADALGISPMEIILSGVGK